jgi:phospholipid transport system substrate-binding protein
MATRRDVLIGMGALSAATWPIAAAAQAEDPAVAGIKAFYDALQSATSGPKAADPKGRLAAVSEAIMRSFDIAAMARLSIGPQWSKIPEPKQASLQEAFGRYFVATYGSQLEKMGGGRFEVEPKPEQRAGGRLVRTRVVDAEGKTTPVDYLVNADGRVVDIYLGGTVSLLAARRSEFDATLKAGGPDALEANLRKRADDIMSRT